jgi:hypothetical protein
MLTRFIGSLFVISKYIGEQQTPHIQVHRIMYHLLQILFSCTSVDPLDNIKMDLREMGWGDMQG